MHRYLPFALAAGLFAVSSAYTAETGGEHMTFHHWEFSEVHDLLGWQIPDQMQGANLGGALWLNIARAPGQHGGMPHFPYAYEGIEDWHYWVWPLPDIPEISSPQGLGVPADQATKVRLRLLNRSPETDGLLFWRTADNPDQRHGPIRFTMAPYSLEWQEVICHVDAHWQGEIEQIMIRPGASWMHGDMWIASIAITDGAHREMPPRPEINTANRVPRISIPGIDQAGFQDAFNVLNECLVTDVPAAGMAYPFMGPGGAYGPLWWQLDTSLNLAGSQWVNQDFAEGVIKGLIGAQAQNPDGRIDLWGGAPIRGQAAALSSIPRYLEVAPVVARRSQDHDFQEAVLDSMGRYLDYWFSPAKLDAETGLVTAVFEETFSEQLSRPNTLAAVDLNVAVALGCHEAARLAEALGLTEQAVQWRERFESLSAAINTRLWDAERSAYYNLNVKAMEHRPLLLCTTFDVFRLDMVPEDRIQPLLEKLVNPEIFNWGLRPLSTVDMRAPEFTESTGPYDGSAWFGNVWTMRNLPITAGLSDIGQHEIAATLNWETIQMFHNNYAEYVTPSTGSGEGVQRYGWTASQYIQGVIEHLFGVTYDALDGRLQIFPRIPEALLGEALQLENLILPLGADCRLQLSISRDVEGQGHVAFQIDGDFPMPVDVLWPRDMLRDGHAEDDAGNTLEQLETLPAQQNALGVRIDGESAFQVHFK